MTPCRSSPVLSAHSQPIENIEPHWWPHRLLIGSSVTCKLLETLANRFSPVLSARTPIPPIEPDRARARARTLGSRRQNVASASTETAFRPASATGAAWDLKSPGATPVIPYFPLQAPCRRLAGRGDDVG